ncbi:hypothetical protein ACTQ49_01675 [Luteococcus sp. Sow4_B9]|uniref:hypothetical protein n=1 Tax=Luteococcus sp. Sow4_B9 TaxID=3438792 RepID=UPI003F99B53A
MRKILDILFWASLVAFLLTGACVVFGQLAGVIMRNGSVVSGADARLSDLAFSLSTLCAAAAFIRGYFPTGESAELDD